MSHVEIDGLVERSGPLKRELLAFAQRPQFDRAFRDEIHHRFGDPVVAEDGEVENFFDWFLQQYRRPDGRNLIDCFLDTRPDLPDAEREFLLQWRDVVEGLFEVVGRDGPVLVTVNLIDDLEYRMRSNVGVSFMDTFPIGSFVITRIVPLGEQWLVSGASSAFGADTRDALLTTAANLAMQHPELVFRNPERLERGWELQRADRAAFVEHFGTDIVVLDAAEAPRRFHAFALERQRSAVGWASGILEPLHPDTQTVGLIYDEWDGLGVYGDLGLVEEAFADPATVRERRHRRVLRTYLTDESLSPVPIVRLAERDHAAADRVFRLLTGKPGFRWADDGETLLRRHKPRWYERPPLPRTVVVSDRLVPYLQEG